MKPFNDFLHFNEEDRCEKLKNEIDSEVFSTFILTIAVSRIFQNFPRLCFVALQNLQYFTYCYFDIFINDHFFLQSARGSLI